MFTAAQLDVMRAGFGVSSDPDGSVHIAGLDIAGAAESIEDPEQILAGHSDRDSTVLSIGAVRAGQLHVVRTYEWIGVPHFQASAEAAALCRHWKVRAVYADATGLGAPVVETLARPRMLGKVVVPYVFTAPSKSALAYNLLSLVGRGGLRLHFGFPEHYWGQLRTARTQVRPNKSMNFYVDERDGHDDFLMSLALLAQAYADLVPARQAVGRLP